MRGAPRRLTRAGVAGALLLGLLVAPTVAAGAAEPRPQTVGEGVVVKRDSWGVPHVYADSTSDLFYGYGYVAAQDRLFQMEMSKRSVNGTVSEVLGPEYVAYDTETRANRDPASLARQYEALSDRDRAIFEGYASGVNAWLEQVADSPQELLPQQYLDFDFDPSPWTGMDVVMVFVGTMANRYSDFTSEVPDLRVRDQLIWKYGEEKGLQLFDQLIWQFDPLAPTTVPGQPDRSDVPGEPGRSVTTRAAGEQSDRSPAATGHARNVRELAPLSPDVPAAAQAQPTFSNVWVTGRSKTAGARAVLVNGPQFGWFNPAYTYSVGLHGAGFDVVGNTPFAYPVVLFGHNGRIGWGATAGAGDTVDIYQEYLKPGDPHRYLFDGRWREMDHRSETVQVRGADPVQVEVYSTVHGRVISTDTARSTAYSKKRSWEGHELDSLLGWIDSTRATNYRQWRSEASRMAISINWYYADDRGNIGYVLNGRYPDRPDSQDTRLPAIGTGEMEWEGIKPFATNPQVYNPDQGYIANWNNKQAPDSLGTWSVVDRVDLIIRELAGPQQLTPEQIWDINYRTTFSDPSAHYFMPYIERAIADEPADSAVRTAGEELLAWDQLAEDVDADGRYDARAVTIFRTFTQELVSLVLADDLDAATFARFFSDGYPTPENLPASQRPGAGTVLAYHALLGEDAGVRQQVDLLNGEDPVAVVHEALEQALTALQAEYGPDRSTWLAPTVPHVFATTNFAGIPQASEDEQLQLPTYMNRGTENDRLVFEGRAVTGCEAAPPGQSGFVAPDGTRSPHYADQMALYADFDCKPMWFTAQEVEGHTVQRERLTP